MTYNRRDARVMLEICRYTYAAVFNDKANRRDRKDAVDWLEKEGKVEDEPILIRNGDTSVASITSYKNRNVVAYMGTKTQFDTPANVLDTLKDWSQNFEALLMPFSLTSEQLGNKVQEGTDIDDLGGKVHRGFLEELQAVQALVVAELMRRGGRRRRVFVTGHSQGGAEAALATRALLAGGFKLADTYTFAAPRAGNKGFVESVPVEVPVHRIEFGDDIVPHVPPTLIGNVNKSVFVGLKGLPFLQPEAKKLLGILSDLDKRAGFMGLGRLCYGSYKTRALRINLSLEDEEALFYDRLWSLARHPERWVEHHHLAGTTEEVRHGKKGNYTALVSEYRVIA